MEAKVQERQKGDVAEMVKFQLGGRMVMMNRWWKEFR